MLAGNADKKTLELQKAYRLDSEKCSICRKMPGMSEDVRPKYHVLPSKPAARFAVKKYSLKYVIV
jgi:hypothetical protein